MKKLISVLLLCSMLFTLVPSVALADENQKSELLTYEPPTDAFDYYIDDRDPMQITDEEFFGEWNSEINYWTKIPYFDYEKYPAMAAVEEAAMAGDYTRAKDELLAYYRSVKDERVTRALSYPSANAAALVSALEKNVYPVITGIGHFEDFFVVDNDWNSHRINVTRSFGNGVAGIEQFRGFILSSVDKHLTYAEFYSRESANPPMLELVVNGMSVSVPACKDAMVRGGEYGNTNYPHDEILTVQESGVYQNFNSNTKRAYIAFDISFLKTTDVISSATLVLNGRNGSGTGDKEIAVYCLYDMSFNEESVVFDDYTDCAIWSCNDENSWDYITSDQTNVKGKACFYHRGNYLSYPANWYSYSGDEKYAFTFLRNHMAMVNSVGFDRSVFNELDLSNQLNFGSRSVLRILDSEYLTGTMFTAMLKTFWLQADYIVNVYYGKVVNNWGSFATLGVFAILARFEEFSVFDEWYEATRVENTRLSEDFVYDDGLCIELPQTYTTTIISTLWSPIDIQVESGMPAPYEDIVIDTIHRLVKNIYLNAGPGGKGFNLADGDDYSGNMDVATIKNCYNVLFPEDEELEYYATGGRSGKLPDNCTVHYPIGMRTYMRNSWGADALALAFTGNYTGSHYHHDILSLSMYAYGQFLLTDQGYGGLLTGDIKKYMDSPPQHNLVSVYKDGVIVNRIGREDAKELGYESNDSYDFVEYCHDTFFYGIHQQRSILFLKDQEFWIVTDYENPKDTGIVYTYEQAWHMLPSANISIDAGTGIVRSNFDGPNVQVVPIGTDDVSVHLADSKFAAATGSIVESKKAIVEKNVAGETTYTTLLVPMEMDKDYIVQGSELDHNIDGDAANVIYFKITDSESNKTDHYYYYHLNDAERRIDIEFASFKTDASTALIQTDKDRNIVSAFLIDASYLEDLSSDETTVFKSTDSVEAVSFRSNSKILYIDSSTIDEEQLQELTIYMENINRVKFNGEVIDEKKSGNYLYFGDVPIIEGKDEEDGDSSNTGTTVGSGTHGTGGSSSGGGGTVKPPVKEEDKPEDVTPVVPVIPVDPMPTTPSYDDVTEDDWFFEYVEELTAKNIVSGDGTGKFNPNDTVKREEFVKMLLLAIDKDIISGDVVFTDVVDTAWYKDYVYTAKLNGIVSGIDENNFGIGRDISRQDMAVMIYRIIKDKDINISEKQVFDDFESVSDYAKNAVSTMRDIGLIDGFENQFNPKNNLTRAEATKVIYQLMKLM